MKHAHHSNPPTGILGGRPALPSLWSLCKRVTSYLTAVSAELYGTATFALRPVSSSSLVGGKMMRNGIFRPISLMSRAFAWVCVITLLLTQAGCCEFLGICTGLKIHASNSQSELLAINVSTRDGNLKDYTVAGGTSANFVYDTTDTTVNGVMVNCFTVGFGTTNFKIFDTVDVQNEQIDVSFWNNPFTNTPAILITKNPKLNRQLPIPALKLKLLEAPSSCRSCP